MYIIIGDPHITKRNLPESKAFFSQLLSKIEAMEKIEPCMVIFLGDGQHNHAVISMEVLNFWDDVFYKLENSSVAIQTMYLVGNHDISGEASKERVESAFSVFKDKYSKVFIVDKPCVIDDVAYVPYTSSEKQFVEDCNYLYKLGAKNTVVCHQTFNGAKFETGMYAPEGFDHKLVPQKNILSGHIHKYQTFDNVIYPGTWRWMTKSDANEKKGIFFCEELNSKKIELEFSSTENVCTPIREYVIEEGGKLPEFKDTEKNYITLIGSSKWANSLKKKIKDQAIIKIHSTDNNVKRVVVSEKVNIDVFIDKHYNLEKDVTKEEVVEYITRAKYE
jgi:DNA repair exonuclease SbcCD nuclease subunit